MRGRSRQVAPKATPGLQFVVRTFDPAGDRAFSHVFREDAADSRFAGGEQACRPTKSFYPRVSRMLNTARKLIAPATAM